MDNVTDTVITHIVPSCLRSECSLLMAITVNYAQYVNLVQFDMYLYMDASFRISGFLSWDFVF